MAHVDPERAEERADERTPPQPVPDRMQGLQVSPLAWASAVGNQAVQRLARQQAEPVQEAEPPAEAVPAEEEAAAPEEEALPPTEAEALAAVPDDEEQLPA